MYNHTCVILGSTVSGWLRCWSPVSFESRLVRVPSRSSSVPFEARLVRVPSCSSLLGWRCAAPFPKPLPYLWQKICDIPYPIHDLTPYHRFCWYATLEKKNTRGNVSKISVSLTCNRHIGSKFINRSLLAWRREGQKVILVALIGGFRSDLSITRKTDGNSGNVSAGVLFSKVVYQQER